MRRRTAPRAARTYLGSIFARSYRQHLASSDDSGRRTWRQPTTLAWHTHAIYITRQPLASDPSAAHTPSIAPSTTTTSRPRSRHDRYGKPTRAAAAGGRGRAGGRRRRLHGRRRGLRCAGRGDGRGRGAVVRVQAGAVRGLPQFHRGSAGDLLRPAQGGRRQRDGLHVLHPHEQGRAAGVRRRARAGAPPRQALRRRRRRLRLRQVHHRHRRRCRHCCVFSIHWQCCFYSGQANGRRRRNTSPELHRCIFPGRLQFHVVDDNGAVVSQPPQELAS